MTARQVDRDRDQIRLITICGHVAILSRIHTQYLVQNRRGAMMPIMGRVRRKTRFCNKLLAGQSCDGMGWCSSIVWRSSMAKQVLEPSPSPLLWGGGGSDEEGTSMDRRKKSAADKAATKHARLARAASRRRRITWSTAASAAEAAGYPLNVALHVTWSALVEGDRREGHCIGMSAVERERKLWSALRLVAARAGVSWIAARAPEYDKRRGLHLHVMLHLPIDGSHAKGGGWKLASLGSMGGMAAIRDVIGVVERLTGAPSERVDMRGWSARGRGRSHHGIVARSACGGWVLQRRVEALGGGGAGLAAYVAKGDGQGLVEGQHRLSNALSALTHAAA
jgi:hypothetical protein